MSSATQEIDDVTVVHFTTASSVRWMNDTSAASHYAGHGPLIFRSAVLIVAVVGALANGTVLTALSKSDQLKTQAVNILFVNQMSLDLFSCVAIIVTHSAWLANIHVSGTSGYLICVFLLTDGMIWLGLYGSKVNLVSIAIERYVKIVHPVWHRNNYRPWMISVVVAAAWIIGALVSVSTGALTTVVIDGHCLWGAVWSSDASKIVCAVFIFMFFFVFVVVALGLCYGKIIMAVRRQSCVFAQQHANDQITKASNLKSLRIQMNAAKTMITISGAFVIFWLPVDCYTLISMAIGTKFLLDWYYTTLFVAYCNVCINPFIYAFKYDLVRNYLIRMIPSRKRGAVNPMDISVIPLETTFPAKSNSLH